MQEKILKPLGDFVSTHLLGCDFVGISSDGEVFVSFESDDPDLEMAAKKKIKDEFGDKIGKVTTVVQTRLKDLQELVDSLNEALEKESQANLDLLDIGDF